jgi:hypothetical protein
MPSIYTESTAYVVPALPLICRDPPSFPLGGLPQELLSVKDNLSSFHPLAYVHAAEPNFDFSSLIPSPILLTLIASPFSRMGGLSCELPALPVTSKTRREDRT